MTTNKISNQTISELTFTTPLTSNKVSKRYSMTLSDFIKDYASHYKLTTLTSDYVSDYNELLGLLIKYKCIECNGVNSNGLMKIAGVLRPIREDMRKFINRQAKAVKINHPLSLCNELHLSDIVVNGGMEFDTYVAAKYLSKKHNAISRGIDFSLTLSDMARLLKVKKCYYSGITLALEGEHKLTLDRKDDSVGYSKENTFACSYTVNQIKNKLMESREYTKGMQDKDIKKMLLAFAELL